MYQKQGSLRLIDPTTMCRSLAVHRRLSLQMARRSIELQRKVSGDFVRQKYRVREMVDRSDFVLAACRLRASPSAVV